MDQLPKNVQIVIALCGPKGCGKDTTADYLIKNKVGTGKIATASWLKRMCAKVFKMPIDFFTVRKEMKFPQTLTLTTGQARKILDEVRNNLPENLLPLSKFNPAKIGMQNYTHFQFNTPREILQIVGTEIIQGIFKSFHPYVAYKEIQDKPGIWFITDMRFQHEAQFAKDMFKLFYVVRIVGRNEVPDGTEEHSSESDWKKIEHNYILDNSIEGLDNLYKNVDILINTIKNDTASKYHKYNWTEATKQLNDIKTPIDKWQPTFQKQSQIKPPKVNW